MPGPWTAEHRAAYEARIAARRRGEPAQPRSRRQVVIPVPVAPQPEPEPVLDDGTTRAALDALRRDVAALAGQTQVGDLRDIMLRIENRVIVHATDAANVPATGIEAYLGQAFVALGRRLDRLEAAVVGRAERDEEVRHLLARIDSRPARVVEFRPDHKRVKDGGEPVRTQRRRSGLTKRAKEPAKG